MILGVFSLLVGALFIVRQRGVKRLMAYSSIEHMGVVALGFGFGGPLGIAGALYHMLNHSLNKSLMFFGAGNMMRAYGTKDIGQIRGVAEHFPTSGALWLAGAVAITGAPPFGLFLSEFTIMRAGLQAVFRLGGLCHGGVADRDLRRLHEPFPRHVLRTARSDADYRKAERMVRRADVGRLGRASRPRRVVAGGGVGLPRRNRARRLASAAMTPFEPLTIELKDLPAALRDLIAARRPCPIAYAWRPGEREIELRYACSERDAKDFRDLALQAGRAGSAASPTFAHR